MDQSVVSIYNELNTLNASTTASIIITMGWDARPIKNRESKKRKPFIRTPHPPVRSRNRKGFCLARADDHKNVLEKCQSCDYVFQRFHYLSFNKHARVKMFAG